MLHNVSCMHTTLACTELSLPSTKTATTCCHTATGLLLAGLAHDGGSTQATSAASSNETDLWGRGA